MGFERGVEVEVASKQVGFVGSYYQAKVIKQLDNKKYIVQYHNLLEDEDSQLPLREIVDEEELRPAPPKVPSTGFSSGEVVDAFANDGWWVGVVFYEDSPGKYEVYFESYSTAETKFVYPASALRVHQDWVNGKYWLSS